MKHYNLVVIGGVAAGMSAASQARRADPKMSICLFEQGNYVSYGACGLPYYICDRIKDHKKLIAINVDDYTAKRNIEIVTGARATNVDPQKKKVSISQKDGERQFSYDKLVIATGAQPVLPPLDGIENQNIFMLRNMEDGIRIKKFIEQRKPKSGILIGGGFIGLEMAESLCELGITCTIVEKMESVAMGMEPAIREMISAELEKHGVALQTGIDIKKIESRENSLAVVHGSGESVEADFIIVSVGVVPNTGFLDGTGIKKTDRGVILVNRKSETNISDIYAAGDCASVRHLITGEDVYMPLGTTANKQGRVAGLQAAGIETEKFPGIVGTQLVKVFSLEIGKAGFSEYEASQAGRAIETAHINGHDIAAYYPGSLPLYVSLVIDAESRALIGGQLAGTRGAALRTNTIAAAIAAGMTVEDFAYLDLGYAPPFAPVWDPVLVAAQKLVKR